MSYKIIILKLIYIRNLKNIFEFWMEWFICVYWVLLFVGSLIIKGYLNIIFGLDVYIN